MGGSEQEQAYRSKESDDDSDADARAEESDRSIFGESSSEEDHDEESASDGDYADPFKCADVGDYGLDDDAESEEREDPFEMLRRGAPPEDYAGLFEGPGGPLARTAAAAAQTPAGDAEAASQGLPMSPDGRPAG